MDSNSAWNENTAQSIPNGMPLSLCNEVADQIQSPSSYPYIGTQNSKRILVASQMANSEFMKGLASFARQNGWHLITDMLHTGTLPKRWDGDGIIAFLPYQSDITSYVAGAETPCVTVSMTDACKAVPCIQPDEFAIGQLAARHLIDRNCREFLWAPFFDNQQNRDRYRGFQYEIDALGGKCRILPPSHREEENTWKDNWDEWRKATELALTTRKHRLGIFAFNDCLSAKIALTAQELGLGLPQDIAIIGVGNDEVECESACITLSSVDPNLEKMSFFAAGILNDLMQNKPLLEETFSIKPRTVVARESTAFSQSGNPRVEMALRYISEHYSEQNLSVTSLADALEISRRQLERDFRNENSNTVRECIERIRMREASRLLIEKPEACISKVAQAVGVSAEGNFFRIFRKCFGSTPSEYRYQRLTTKKLSP